MVKQTTLPYHGLLYWDRTLPILDGRAATPGLQLQHIVVHRPGDLFRRQAQDACYPVSEMSFSTFLIMCSQGDDRLVGLPVFPSRNFRHRDIYVSHRSGIEEPKDLRGARVGVPDYQLTAALWARAVLQEDYGVRSGDMHWHVGGLRSPGYVPRRAHSIPASVRVDQIPSDTCLERMLAVGELDALISVTAPPSLGTSSRRLFGEFVATEKDYYGRTRLFPIMHLVVAQRSALEKSPGLARSIFDIFVQAKHIGAERLNYLSCLAVGLPWLAAHVEEMEETFEGDAFPYGVEANRHTIEAGIGYAHDQGLIEERLAVEDLFAAELLTT